jgi:DNA-binding transcriptional LysR family regulator
MLGYRDMVPEGHLSSFSDCTAKLLEMLADGRLDAAIVTSPVHGKGLLEHRICEDRILLCLRRDSPFASALEIPKEVISEKLRVLFDREYHPGLHDRILRKFKRAGIELHPTETYSAPAEMQFLVKARSCFGLIREGSPLDPELIAKPMEGLELRVGTVFVCHRDQQRPIFPMLAYRMTQQCMRKDGAVPRKPPRSTDPTRTRVAMSVSNGSLASLETDRPARRLDKNKDWPCPITGSDVTA